MKSDNLPYEDIKITIDWIFRSGIPGGGQTVEKIPSENLKTNNEHGIGQNLEPLFVYVWCYKQ